MAWTARPNMGQRSLLETVERYPVTFGACALAIAATVTWHTGGNVEAYVLDDHVWGGELWRLVTCVFPHVSLIHLLFNLYWTWRFGLLVEEFYRWRGTLAVFLFFAVFSSVASYAAGETGVGLSGVGYGLFGMLWIMSRRDSRLRGAIDAATVYIFVGWFFLCILLTWAGVMAVGNVAHGAGAAAGIAAGFGLADLVRGWRKRAARLGMGAGLILVCGAAALRSPPVDAFGSHTRFLFGQGWRAFEAQEYPRAVRYLERGLRRDGSQLFFRYQLGVSYGHVGRARDQQEVFHSLLAAHDATPGPGFLDTPRLLAILKTLGLAAEKEGRRTQARRHLERASRIRRAGFRNADLPGPAGPDPEIEAALARLEAGGPGLPPEGDPAGNGGPGG